MIFRLKTIASRLVIVALLLAGLFAYSRAQEGKSIGLSIPSLPLPLASGGLGVASIPIFKVTLTANQSVTSATWTKIAFDGVTFDSGSYWSTSNKNYLPLVSGTYLFCATLSGIATYTLAATNLIVSISKNGLTGGAGVRTGEAALSVPTGASLSPTVSTCSTVVMNGSTDTIEADAFISGTSPNVVGDALFDTFFTGYRVSP